MPTYVLFLQKLNIDRAAITQDNENEKFTKNGVDLF